MLHVTTADLTVYTHCVITSKISGQEPVAERCLFYPDGLESDVWSQGRINL